jgi:hypothetical protein
MQNVSVMHSSTESQESTSSACPHCGRSIHSADSLMRRRLADSEHYQAAFSRVARSPEGAPIEELRTDGLV